MLAGFKVSPRALAGTFNSQGLERSLRRMRIGEAILATGRSPAAKGVTDKDLRFFWHQGGSWRHPQRCPDGYRWTVQAEEALRTPL